MARRLALGLAALLAVALVACGNDAGPLAKAERAMATLDAGRIDFALTAGTAGEKPVGFRMQGPFAFEDGLEFPTFDLRSTSLLGAETIETRLMSDGASVYVMDNGTKVRVPSERASLLRLGNGGGGFADLGVGGWVDDPSVEERSNGSRVITGTVNAADLLSDLARISGQVAGRNSTGLDRDSASRIARLVRHSEFRAELDRTDLPRRLHAVVDFGRELPAALRQSLGPYASPRLEVNLEMQPADH